jgi:hypothetical protein
MALQPGDEVTAGCLFDHFGQRFEDLLLGLGDSCKQWISRSSIDFMSLVKIP